MRGSLGDTQRLQHILKAILEIESFIKGVAYVEFSANRLIQQACVANFGIIGEASTHLTLALKQRYNIVNWQQVKAFRNVIVHEYFKVDIKVVWQIMQTELPDLKQKVQKILDDIN